MLTRKLARISFTFTVACAAWLTWFLAVRETGSFAETFVCSLLALLAATATLWVGSALVEQNDDSEKRSVDTAPQGQVAITRALRLAPCAITMGDLFAHLAAGKRPLSVTQLKHELHTLERASIVQSDYDAASGELVWKLVTARHRQIDRLQCSPSIITDSDGSSPSP